jgi:all-trans-retinol dehydrogenase (NAD+)
MVGPVRCVLYPNLSKLSKINNRTILITGGASGLGKLFAQRCLREKAHAVILWDINTAQLEQTVAAFRAEGHAQVHGYSVDVSDAESVLSASRQVLAEHGAVDILFNNAGIVVGKSFEEHSYRDIERTIGINVLGVMYVARAFLPAMIEQGRGHVVNIASAAGLIPNPNMSVYASSKWAVVGWSESLRLELESMGKELHVTTVEPSYVNTGMFDGVKAPFLTPILEPNELVDKVVRAVKADRILVREPGIVKLLPLMRGLLPTRAFDLMARQFGVYDSMNDFVGRKENIPLPQQEKKH